jgi:hypothetical protein
VATLCARIRPDGNCRGEHRARPFLVGDVVNQKNLPGMPEQTILSAKQGIPPMRGYEPAATRPHRFLPISLPAASFAAISAFSRHLTYNRWGHEPLPFGIQL